MLDTERLREHHFEITYGLGQFMVEHLVRLHNAFEGDMTAAIVLGTIGQYNYQRFYQEARAHPGATFDELVQRGVHLELLRPCNAMSVSASTGIPRETVRRKIRWLIEKGWVRQIGRDKLVLAPHVGRHFADFDRETLARFHRTASDILRLLEPNAPRRRGTPK